VQLKVFVFMASAFFRGTELKVLPNVYQPSDDSFLLAESVELEPDSAVLDLGCGSGIQGINAALLGAKTVVCTDVNKKALENAEENAERLGFSKKFEFREGGLFDCVKGESFDLIIFNPPYVHSNGKKFAELDGGKNGREILDLFLEGFSKHLKKGGKCFFLQTSLNGEKETGEILRRQGFSFEVVARKKIFFEELLVFRVE